jgi:hypothetical protein
MTFTLDVCNNTAWTKLCHASQAQLRAVHHYFERRNLESALAALLDR